MVSILASTGWNQINLNKSCGVMLAAAAAAAPVLYLPTLLHKKPFSVKLNINVVFKAGNINGGRSFPHWT